MTAIPAIEVLEISIDELRLDPANPRRISDAQFEALRKSLQTCGLVQPVFARRWGRTVIRGHKCLTAAWRL